MVSRNGVMVGNRVTGHMVGVLIALGKISASWLPVTLVGSRDIRAWSAQIKR